MAVLIRLRVSFSARVLCFVSPFWLEFVGSGVCPLDPVFWLVVNEAIYHKKKKNSSIGILGSMNTIGVCKRFSY